MTTALEGGEGSAARHGRSTAWKDPLPIVQEAGWAPGPVWTGRKFLPPTGIRSPDRPARSSVAIPTELPGPLNVIKVTELERMTWTKIENSAKFDEKCAQNFG